eukprot:CAMPEP_0184655720 /NCGR_PEP_ID=MMETSP0308-20130426/14375_1 /TAXON_ID=38269 /ORGANISM="Gloeochaete witrockiana, Strain SAG 46.84" /LENGTH=111 /DNA_ID=CAMNT_0027092429 /DNA_START=330 /DNA_END=665 /DNA_ORIENTATION=-
MSSQATDLEVDDELFIKEVENSSAQLTVAFFSAPWCGPCQLVKKTISKVASDFPMIKIVQLNLDDAPTTASKVGVRSIPHLAFYKQNGTKVDTIIGAVTADTLELTIKKHL